MAIKKSQLYSTLWESCNNQRGGMDASQYKDFVLMVLFLKYLSDKNRAGADLLIDIPDAFTDDNDNNLTEAALRKLVRERKDDDYMAVWKAYLKQYDRKKALNKELKDMKAGLTEKVKEEYESLKASPDLLRAFVVDKKWLKTLREKFYEEQDNAVLGIISRVQALHDRYADNLPQLEANEKRLEKELGKRLEQMGYQL